MDRIFKEENAKGKESRILEEFFETREKSALEEKLREDSRYQKKRNKISKCLEELENVEFTRRQWDVIDSALSSCNERDSEYARVAYCLGFQDGMKLLMEVFVKNKKY